MLSCDSASAAKFYVPGLWVAEKVKWKCATLVYNQQNNWQSLGSDALRCCTTCTTAILSTWKRTFRADQKGPHRKQVSTSGTSSLTTMSTEDHSEGHCKLNQAPLGTTAPQLNRPEAYKKYVDRWRFWWKQRCCSILAERTATSLNSLSWTGSSGCNGMAWVSKGREKKELTKLMEEKAEWTNSSSSKWQVPK